jgi:DNA-binding transcriptional MerR regulator
MEALAVETPGKRVTKSASAFRTISEVAKELDVPSHVLRFWETKFSQVKPLKRGGGRRYYRPEDIALLRHIRSLLYDDGYTIKGVQKLLRETNGKTPERAPKGDVRSLGVPQPEPKNAALSATSRGAVSDVMRELESLRDLLRQD